MTHSIQIQVDAREIPRFFPLFQEGILLETETGISVREFLCRLLGLHEDYVEKRISTIFLDGKPVDDLDRSRIAEGSVLALSAAMPGLVGATLRKGGYYAPMRRAISHETKDHPLSKTRGKIRLKLFNMILQELSPKLLGTGVWVQADSLKNVIGNLSAHSFHPTPPLPEHGDIELLVTSCPTEE